MPQGRRKDFSGKQKKLQMKMKRDRKDMEANVDNPNKETIRGKTSAREDDEEVSSVVVGGAENLTGGDRMLELSECVSLGTSSRRAGGKRDRYDLRFRVETKEELAASRAAARVPIPDPGSIGTTARLGEHFPADLAFPRRPPWRHGATKQALEAAEQRYFREYVDSVFAAHHDGVGHFELNLETWRQLWRVVEMSDVLVVVADARYPAAMVPPSLFKAFANEMGRDVVVALNKVDLIPPSLAAAWKRELQRAFSGVRVVFFSSCPNYNLRGALGDEEAGLKYRRLRGRISMVSEGASAVLEACRDAVSKAGADVNLDSWEQLITEAAEKRKAERGRRSKKGEEAAAEKEETVRAEEGSDADLLLPPSPASRFRDGVLTLGLVGHPNAGKSSLINSLVGRRVVSVSKQPGHTKHFQTIFVTPSVRLCDCPGLVFPSTWPKPVQVLTGSYPISQVREPFSVVHHLAERIDLPSLLRVAHPSGGRSEKGWSAYDVCEAWAVKRGFVTARSNRPDLNRAANHILRLTLEGKITLAQTPEGFNPHEWEGSAEVREIEELLQVNADSDDDDDDCSGEEDDSEEEREKEEEVVEEEEEEEERPQLKNKFSALLDDEGSD